MDINKVIQKLEGKKKKYHESMVEAGYELELVENTIIYTKPAIIVSNDEDDHRKNVKTKDGKKHPVMSCISL